MVTARCLQGGALYEHPSQACAGQLEGNFFKSLVSIAGAKEVLEVGMFTGTTALAIAEALPADGKVGPELACLLSAPI